MKPVLFAVGVALIVACGPGTLWGDDKKPDPKAEAERLTKQLQKRLIEVDKETRKMQQQMEESRRKFERRLAEFQEKWPDRGQPLGLAPVPWLFGEAPPPLMARRPLRSANWND